MMQLVKGCGNQSRTIDAYLYHFCEWKLVDGRLVTSNLEHSTWYCVLDC